MEKTIVTKESFRDWKANPVTKHIMNTLMDRIHALQDELGQSAGIDPLSDRRTVGAIAAYSDLINIDFDGVSND